MSACGKEGSEQVMGMLASKAQERGEVLAKRSSIQREGNRRLTALAFGISASCDEAIERLGEEGRRTRLVFAMPALDERQHDSLPGPLQVLHCHGQRLQPPGTAKNIICQQAVTGTGQHTDSKACEGATQGLVSLPAPALCSSRSL